MAHFVHYLRREVVQVAYDNPSDPWFAENQPDDQGLATPAFHVTRCTQGPAVRVAIGDTIWLFAQLFSPWGKLPPALDARIEVTAIARPGNANGFRFKAGPESTWFPLSDASKTLSSLRTITADGATTSLLSSAMQPVGRALQSIRELDNEKVVLRSASKLAVAKVDFVSYRLLDGTRDAFMKVRQLVQDGRAVFWDRWSLPRRLAERREFLKDRALDDHIRNQIEAASVVWGIATPLYGADNSYSEKELSLASDLKKLRLHSPSRNKEQRTRRSTCVLEMVERRAGGNPVQVAASHGPGIECCSAAGDGLVEAYTERRRGRKKRISCPLLNGIEPRNSCSYRMLPKGC